MVFMPTPAGARQHQIEIQANFATRSTDNTFGEQQDDWRTVGEREWAKIEPLTGKKERLAGKVEANATHLIKFPYRPDATTNHRIKFGARTFDINVATNVDERDIETWCWCTEGKGQG